ncbi:MAG: hypothetical protein KKH28_03815 [Elusimicrobia bacterium]|nr:hypothetical protein [Elusimicrobiota bacterium]
MKEIDEKIKELEEIASKITATRNNIVNQFIEQWEPNPNFIDERFYKFLEAEWKVSPAGTAYGTQLKESLFKILKGVLEKETYKVGKEESIRPKKREDIVITSKNSSQTKVVVEVKSFIENSNSSQSIRSLEKAKNEIESRTDIKHKYFVFASSHSCKPSFDAWKRNKDWIFLQSHRLNDGKHERIWTVKDFAGYYPLITLIESIKKFLRFDCYSFLFPAYKTYFIRRDFILRIER